MYSSLKIQLLYQIFTLVVDILYMQGDMRIAAWPLRPLRSSMMSNS